jgi:hypothetical protein
MPEASLISIFVEPLDHANIEYMVSLQEQLSKVLADGI